MDKNKDGKIIYINGWKKGIYVGHSVTEIKGQKEKYGYTLQEVNDRINSYRPNTLINYKFSGDHETIKKLKIKQLEELYEWDRSTWNYGEYLDFGDKNETPDGKLFLDFKILAKSAASLRGYLNINKVRGGTTQDVDDFLNFVVLKLLERRKKQFEFDSECRILDNWPAHIALVIPQYLILFNKSKFDYEVEAFWPMVKDEKTGEYVPKDFGIEQKFSMDLISQEDFLKLYEGIVSKIPEAKGLEVDILCNLVYGISFCHKNMVARITDVVKIQLSELKGEIIIEL